jgi:hypothetical protein
VETVVRTKKQRDDFRKEMCDHSHENRDMHELIVALMELCRTIDEASDRIAGEIAGP